MAWTLNGKQIRVLTLLPKVLIGTHFPEREPFKQVSMTLFSLSVPESSFELQPVMFGQYQKSLPPSNVAQDAFSENHCKVPTHSKCMVHQHPWSLSWITSSVIVWCLRIQPLPETYLRRDRVGLSLDPHQNSARRETP
jgi:hypothetical protein